MPNEEHAARIEYQETLLSEFAIAGEREHGFALAERRWGARLMGVA